MSTGEKHEHSESDRSTARAPGLGARSRDRRRAKSSSPALARNFVTLKIVTRSGVTGIGDATLNGRELAVASYLQGSPRAESHRPRRGPHRGHLAVLLSRRVLAPRPRDDDGDRRGRRRAVGHPRQDDATSRCISCSAGVRAKARSCTATRTARTSTRPAPKSASTSRRATRRCARRAACPASRRPTASRI